MSLSGLRGPFVSLLIHGQKLLQTLLNFCRERAQKLFNNQLLAKTCDFFYNRRVEPTVVKGALTCKLSLREEPAELGLPAW